VRGALAHRLKGTPEDDDTLPGQNGRPRRVTWASDPWARAGAILVVLSLASCGSGTPVSAPTEAATKPSATTSTRTIPARDRAASAAVHNGLLATVVYWTDNGGFDDMRPADLEAIEPTLRFVEDGPSTGPASVSYAVAGEMVTVAVASPTGRCFAIRYEDGSKSAALGRTRTCDASTLRSSDFRPAP
jgi:predicted small lipoprotein YifL